MPELPEVETIARKLKTVLPGKTIRQVTQLHPKSFVGDPAVLTNTKIHDVSRRAKMIRIHLPQEKNLIIHLKMTGQLIYVDDNLKLGGGHPTADWIHQLPGKHTRVHFEFIDGAHLFFNDQRLFGWIKVVSDPEVQEVYAQLGPDITDEHVTLEYLLPLLKGRSIPIKQAIMDISIVCGLGNIYACDALNLAQIHPERPAKSLTPEEVAKLLQSSQLVIKQGIELGGTTFDGKYVDIEGMAGQYQSVVRVYGREGKECRNCKGQIVKSKLGGRGTYYCQQCQI
jgi:formamidopyrimidine-DNA glycosylase